MTDDGTTSPRKRIRLEESAFPKGMFPLEIATAFWRELRKVLPAHELHVVDPYILDSGTKPRDPDHAKAVEQYARLVATALKPALLAVQRVIFVHGAPPRSGEKELLEREVATVNAAVAVEFQRGSGMHGRYLVADRARAISMDFSFNQVGKRLGLASIVDDSDELNAVLAEVDRLHPRAAATGTGRQAGA